MTRILVVLVLSLSSQYLASAQNNKVAIVFGMANYEKAGILRNPTNDADSIANILQSLNFDVVKWNNLSLRKFSDEIDKWGKNLSQYEVALFYFSGHGAEVAGENYLFPIDVKAVSESDVRFEAMPLGKILGKMEDATNAQYSRLKCNIVILDACRNNPFSKSWSKSLGNDGGLANVSTPEGTFIGFAAKPGKTASGAGLSNSPYTQAILKHIRTPNRSLDGIFNDVNSTTRYLTGGQQTPYKNSSLGSDFYFLTTSSSETKSISIVNRDEVAANRIAALMNVLNFDLSINELIVEEYGNQFSNTVPYSSLPIAAECQNREIRYYWRKISESKFRDEIYGFFISNNLMQYVSNDSYIIYNFYNDKLYSISLKLFFTDIVFHQRIGQALGVVLDDYPTQFYFDRSDSYSVFSLSPEVNLTSIAFGTKAGQKYCDADWWFTK